MANMASGLYVPSIVNLLNDATPVALDMTNASNVVILMLDTYAGNEGYDTIATYTTTLTDYEVLEAAPGYDRATKTVGGTPTLALGNAGQVKYAWSTTVSWTSATFTANGMVVMGAAASHLPAVGVGFAGNYTATNGTFTITQNAAGIYVIDLVP